MVRKFKQLPEGSVLRDHPHPFQYLDSYHHPLARPNVQAEDLLLAFFTSAPGWVDWLFRLRNAIVKRLGLKADMADLAALRPPFLPGQRLGLFTLFALTPSEVILGTDDRHLDFRVSLLLHSGQLKISTGVVFHNVFGRVYFFLVGGFHRLIVPAMLTRMAQRLENPDFSKAPQNPTPSQQTRE